MQMGIAQNIRRSVIHVCNLSIEDIITVRQVSTVNDKLKCVSIRFIAKLLLFFKHFVWSSKMHCLKICVMAWNGVFFVRSEARNGMRTQHIPVSLTQFAFIYLYQSQHANNARPFSTSIWMPCRRHLELSCEKNHQSQTIKYSKIVVGREQLNLHCKAFVLHVFQFRIINTVWYVWCVDCCKSLGGAHKTYMIIAHVCTVWVWYYTIISWCISVNRHKRFFAFNFARARPSVAVRCAVSFK